MLAKIDYIDNGFEKALENNGNIAEACTGNIFVVKNGVISTPGLDLSILPGISRKLIIELARDHGY